MERRNRRGKHQRVRGRYRSRARKDNRRVRPSVLGTAHQLLEWVVKARGYLAVLCAGYLG